MTLTPQEKKVAKLLGEVFALPASTPEQARATLKRVVKASDENVLDVAWAVTGEARHIVWATPAYLWLWLGLNQVHGELALVYDRLVFFQHSGGSIKRHFVLKVSDVTARWRTRSVHLDAAGKSYKVSFMPPRYTNLTTVAGSPEEPGVSELADQFAAKSSLVEGLGLLSESLSMIKTRKVAKVHADLWRGVLEEARAGQGPPWKALDQVFGAAHATGPTDAADGSVDAPAADPVDAAPVAPGGRREQVRSMVEATPGLKVKDMAELLGTNPSNLYRPINQLIADGLLRREGQTLHLA
jgi:hypothetical protein